MRTNAGIKLEKRFAGYIMILVAIVYLFPFYLILANSFKTNREYMLSIISFPSGFNIEESYITAIRDMAYLTLFKNSLIVFVVAIPGIVILGSMTAYKLCRVKGRFSTILFLIFLSCMIIPFQGLMISIIRMVSRLNLTNNVLGLSLVYWAITTPVVIFMYHGFIKGIPYNIEESARIDGANGYATFFIIIFPLLRPITLTVVTLFGLGIWNDFLLPLLLLQRRSNFTLPLGTATFFGESSNRPNQWPAIYAALIISTTPIILFLLGMQKYIVSGITSGAVKG